MGRRAAAFTKVDLERALAVARKHDMSVEVAPDGTIRIIPVQPAAATVDTGQNWVP